jgi:multiple sugar transport system ATP-binding protein
MIKQRSLTAILVTHDQSEANAMADRIAIMESGRLEQYGTGAELRDEPANLHVATFFGEPPMNVMSGEFGAQGLRLKDLDGFVPKERPSKLREPIVTAGIRPIHVIIGDDGFQGRVVSNRWLGDQAHVVISAGETAIVAVSNDRVPASVGEIVPFGLATGHLHIFDAASGERYA